MAIISKEVAQRHLEMWLEAEAAVSTGQSYQIEQMQLNRASLKQILGKQGGRGRAGRAQPGQEPYVSLLAP